MTDADNSNNEATKARRKRLLAVGVVLLVVVAVSLGIAFGVKNSKAAATPATGSSGDSTTVVNTPPQEQEDTTTQTDTKENEPEPVPEVSTPAPTDINYPIVSNFVLEAISNCANENIVQDEDSIQNKAFQKVIEEIYAVSKIYDYGIEIPLSIGYESIAERFALMTLYYANAGDFWINKDKWLSMDDVCTWYGVDGCKSERTDGECAVTSVNLSQNGLMFQLPVELCCLPCLESLDLSDNLLTGQLPTCLLSWNLDKLDLGNNDFDVSANEVSGPSS